MRSLWFVLLALIFTASGAFAVMPGAGWENSLKPAGVPGSELTLVSAGKTDYKIIIPFEYTPQDQKAAYDLAKYLNIMTGANFPIIQELRNYLPTGHEISIGKTYMFQRANLPEASLDLGDEGYAIVEQGETLYLIGGKKRGPIYAVCALLEEDLGCRWYDRQSTPTIPYAPELKFRPVSRHYVPRLNIRDLYYWDAFNADWAIANRVNFTWQQIIPSDWGGGNKFAHNLFAHTFNVFVPPSTYFSTHPEYFSLVNGKRQTTQLCLTNPDVLQIVINGVLADLRDDLGSNYISVSQNDASGFCECPNCKAIDDVEGTRAGTLITFVNKVAEAVEKEFPSVQITTLAYMDTYMPPKTIKPRSNVVIQLCTDRHIWVSPLLYVTETQDFQNAMKAWHAAGAKMHIWDYTTNFSHYPLPLPIMPVVAPNIQFYIDNGADGVMLEGSYQTPCGDNAVMRSWIWAKQLWDINRPTLALMHDFIYGYYGEAAEPMWQYNQMLWNICEKARAGEDGYTLPNTIRLEPTSLLLSQEYIPQSATYFAQAESLATNPETIRRIRVAKFPYLYTRLCQDVGYVNISTGLFNVSSKLKLMSPDDKAQHIQMLNEFEQTAQSEGVQVLTESGNPQDCAEKIAHWKQFLTTYLASQDLGSSAYRASATYQTSYPYLAFDYDLSSYWVAPKNTGWIEVDLGKVYDISNIWLKDQQSPSGRTVHDIICSQMPIGESGAGNSVYHFDEVTTNAQILTADLPAGTLARYVQVRTSVTPSWVAWADIKVFARSANIAGIVRSAEQGNLPVKGAVVATRDGANSVITDENGAYSMMVTAGNINLITTKSGYAPAFASIASQPGYTFMANFDLKKPLPVAGIKAALQQSDGNPITLTNLLAAATGTSTFRDGSFYVEEISRAAGIRAVPGDGVGTVNTGDRVGINGYLSTDAATGERFIYITSITNQTSGKALGPLGMSNKTVAGNGLSSAGLLAKVWGKVTYSDPNAKFIYIDDGSNIRNGSGYVGIKIIVDATYDTGLCTAVAVGDIVSVTGIVQPAAANAIILATGIGHLK